MDWPLVVMFTVLLVFQEFIGCRDNVFDLALASVFPSCLGRHLVVP
jgi:hypothetical protein